MKATGIVRRVDMLGRLVIPKETRNTLKINFGDPIEIYTEKDEIILKKYSPILNAAEYAENIARSLFKTTERNVVICDDSSYLACEGETVGKLKGCPLHERTANAIRKQQTEISNFSEGGAPFLFDEYINDRLCNQLFLPIIFENRTVGGIILADGDKNRPITAADVKTATLAADLVSSNAFN